MVGLVWRAHPRFFVCTLGMNMLTGLQPLANIYIRSSMLALLAVAVHGNTPVSLFFHKLLFLFGLMGALAILTMAITHLSGTIQGLYQTKVTNHVQGLIARKAASLDLAFFENPDFHNKMHNAANEAATRPLSIVQQLMDVVASLTTIIGLGAVVFLWHSWLIPLVLLPPILMLWLTSSMAPERVEMNLKRTETTRRAGYLRGLLTGERAAKEIRLFNLRDFLLSNLDFVCKEMYEQNRQHAKRRLLRRGSLAMALSLNQPMLVGYTAWQLLLHGISFRQFSLYTQSISYLQRDLKDLSDSIGRLYESNLFITNLFDFLAFQPQIEAPRPTGAAAGISPLPQIEFRHVSFCYPGTKQIALQDITFTIEPGVVTALVGGNGSGKSTVVKLMAGLYEPDAGEILLDGVDIKKLNRAELRDYFSIILQDFLIYNLSTYDNIGVGRVELINDHTRVESAAREAGLDEIVKALPYGYETILARNFKRGHELSGGQRQIVALARALLRNAPILVMDEPTAALDVHNESRFFRKLLGVRPAGKQSIVLISHRLTAVRHAQRILVLDKGRLVEEGDHQHLMALHARYAEMFNLQLQMYGEFWLEELADKPPEPGGPVATQLS